MKKIVEFVYERLRLRPLCTVCMLFLLSVCIYVNSSLYKKGQDIYQPDCKNYFEEKGIKEGDSVRLTGRIRTLNLREINGEATYVAMLDQIKTTDEKQLTKAFSQIQVYFPIEEENRIGQIIEFTGKLSYFDRASNPGEFDAYEYYLNNDILFRMYDGQVDRRSASYSKLKDGLYRLRLTGEGILQEYLGTEDSAIMKAMIFGNKNEISEEVKDLFRKNGIAHILAISGLHISLIAMCLYKILKKTGLATAFSALISAVVIILYGILVGFPLSAVRAIIMFLLYLLSRVWLRTYDIMTSMSVALTLMLLLHPARIMDSGMQLSFSAVAGVSFLCMQFDKNIWKAPKWLNSVFVSLFVFLATMPVILRAYYETAFYSVLLNLIIIPLMSLLMLSGIGIILLARVFLLKWLAIPLTYIVRIILWLYKGSCSFLTERGMGRMNLGSPKAWQICLFYLLLMLAVSVRFGDKRRNWAKFLHLAGCILLSLFFLFLRPHSGLKVWMLDVGQGDCMVIQNEKGHTHIIDGGSSSRKNIGDRVIVPMLKYYGVNEIEGIFITHPDADHMNGIREVLKLQQKECLRVKNVYMYEGFLEDEGMADILELAKENNNQVRGIRRGQSLVDGRLKIKVLYPDKGKETADSNNASLVMHVSYGEFDMLTTGDVEEEGEKEIVDKETLLKQAIEDREVAEDAFEILKVAHHGSSSSSSEEIMAWVRPEIALISVGKDNSYGHPHMETLERLEAYECRIIRSDRTGAVLFSINKKGQIKSCTRFYKELGK